MMSNTLDTLFEELKIRPMTRHMVIPCSLISRWHLLREWLRVDNSRPLSSLNRGAFGVRHPMRRASMITKRYQALCERVQETGSSAGNGSMLNALIRKYAPAYAQVVIFTRAGMKSLAGRGRGAWGRWLPMGSRYSLSWTPMMLRRQLAVLFCSPCFLSLTGAWSSGSRVRLSVVGQIVQRGEVKKYGKLEPN